MPLSNVVVLASHGSFFVPEDLRKRLAIDERLLKNFSDFGTKYLLPDCVPEEQRVVAEFSRALGDPNRALDDTDLFRETDFGQRPLWKEPLTDKEKSECIEEFYQKYHHRVAEAIKRAEEVNKRILVVDIHDTGNMILGSNPGEDVIREWSMPPISLGDREGRSCDPAITQFFARALGKNLGLEVSLNTPYKGGYVTEKYGEEYNQALPQGECFQRNVIQLEIGRYLYVDEATQTVLPEKCQWLREGIERALEETSQYLIS